MRSRYRYEINRDTRRPPVGEKREERSAQLHRLSFQIDAVFPGCGWTHSIFLRARVHPYEDLSSFFREVDELAKRESLIKEPYVNISYANPNRHGWVRLETDEEYRTRLAQLLINRGDRTLNFNIIQSGETLDQYGKLWGIERLYVIIDDHAPLRSKEETG